MRVLFFSHQSSFLYGGEVVTLEFLRELKAQGVEVHFAAPAGPYLERARESAICHEVSSRQFSRRVAQLPAIAASLWKTRNELRTIVEANSIHVLHATSLKAMAFAWAAGVNIPVIWHHHDILPASATNSLWVKGLSARAARILVPSEATRVSLLQAGVPSGRVHVLRNGFRLGDWSPRPPQREGHLFRVGLVGEVSPRKGTDRLEGVLRELGDLKGLQFLIAGAGLSNPEWAEALQRRLASRQVRFLGKLTRMKLFYHELDVLLVPSRQDPLPTVIVEAGLSGVPVVGSRVGGIPEMVQDGVNGFLFDDEAAAAAAIRKVQADWKKFSAGARAYAEDRYDIQILTRELLGHYRAVGAD